ncbi:MAG: translation elongation factor Ts [Anaerorhabdus sp.]
MSVTAAQVKELREITGAGMMDCKKALTECDGDIQRSIDWLREKGISKAAKKADRIAAEGLSKVIVDGNKACLVEINSETDFVAKNKQFLELLDSTTNALLQAGAKTMEEAQKIQVNGKTIEDLFVDATATIGEKITFRRFAIMEKTDADTFGAYIHMGGKISTCTILKNTTNAEIAKDMAMQVASMNPSYVSRDDMPSDIVEHERAIQTEITKNDPQFEGKPEKVITGAIEGRVSKSLQEMCLVDQIFFKNPSEKVAAVLKAANTEVASFVRFAVGEGIEKKEENFAEEVAKIK